MPERSNSSSRLVRAFASAPQLENQLGFFCGSEEWRQKCEYVVMPPIESYQTGVIPLIELPAALSRPDSASNRRV